MTVFDIRSYEGVGPLAFGMSPTEVHAILGQPRTTTKNFLRERSDLYPHLTIGYAKDTDALIEVGMSSQVDVRFQGVSLFSAKDALTSLIAADGAPLEGHGSIIFLALGIAVIDFDSDQESDRVVSIFQRGRWDAMKNLKLYTAPERT